MDLFPLHHDGNAHMFALDHQCVQPVSALGLNGKNRNVQLKRAAVMTQRAFLMDTAGLMLDIKAMIPFGKEIFIPTLAKDVKISLEVYLWT